MYLTRYTILEGKNFMHGFKWVNTSNTDEQQIASFEFSSEEMADAFALDICKAISETKSPGVTLPKSQYLTLCAVEEYSAPPEEVKTPKPVTSYPTLSEDLPSDTLFLKNAHLY